MLLNHYETPTPINEKVKTYAKGTIERERLIRELDKQQNSEVLIPLIIGKDEFITNTLTDVPIPHNHKKIVARFYNAEDEQIKMAINAALKAKERWSKMDYRDRAAIFLRAAALISGPYREILNASTMLAQSKTIHQAEIDAACELSDFLRFNVRYMEKIINGIDLKNDDTSWNKLEYIPLEGFVFAISPFNFTSISGNLAAAPAMMGNVVLWKPAKASMLSSYYIMKIFQEAGLPPGVINLIGGQGSKIGPTVLDDENLAGVHFTGSTDTFNQIWKQIGVNISKKVYRCYPNIVGETGGKNFLLAHTDADINSLSTAMIQGAFEYQGQKCSALSRAYIPHELTDTLLDKLKEKLEKTEVTDVTNFRSFMGALIDKKSFDKVTSYIEHAKTSNDAKIIYGGKYDSSVGYFVGPTIIVTTNPLYKSMTEEIFGPVLTIYSYDSNRLDHTISLIDSSTKYALTGAIFAKDRNIINYLTNKLQNAAGNFYINDKPTGAIVGKQPFGGARSSGTNDKAGSFMNLVRWTNIRAIKENFLPTQNIKYPSME